MADEFGGDIPVGPFAIIGDDSIGRGIVATLEGHRSRAVLMQNHGVFTIGRDARDAVKAAVMCEDVARTVHLARQLGEPIAIPQESIDALFDRYQNVYGQSPQGEPHVSHASASSPTSPSTRSGSSPAARGCTAKRPCARSRSSRRRSRGACRSPPTSRSPSSGSRC